MEKNTQNKAQVPPEDEIAKEILDATEAVAENIEESSTSKDSTSEEHDGSTSISSLEKEELERLRTDAAEYKAKYLRALAELENTRKRLSKEKMEMTRYAEERVILDFLQPIDGFSAALGYQEHMTPETKQWAQGFSMLLNQFKSVLEDHGVMPFDSLDKPFDPSRHEAVETVVDSTLEEGTIVNEMLKGYLRGEKVIRPSRVTVTKKAQANSEEVSSTE